MKNLFLSLTLCAFLFAPLRANALFGVGDIVYDPAAVAQLIKQIEETVKMIRELKDMGKTLDKLQDWAEIDHTALAGGWNAKWWGRYKSILDRILSTINGYQNGGAFSDINIERIMRDEIYPGYHAIWEGQEDLSTQWHNTKKQMLWTKIQMKHASVVGSQLRKEISAVATSTNDIHDRNMQAVGTLQAIKIGTEMTMNVVKGLELTNTHLNEFVQAYTALGLEENHAKGRFANAKDAAMKGVEDVVYDRPSAPKSPIE